ncbi:inward rectifier K channel (IRK-C) family protein [Achlya hypogyna]|uniref:Inward rectifier K channel (IRK-C) family protein n=1 Tax=Achlya hypogyna TaxID=1202772 RepID=A0A1V9Z292_ACHHY|nr:inward rectifier K channel (IRK-C) family protein [Achlya hypogyna]
MSLPLRPNYFSCPPLNPGDHAYLLAQAERVCYETALNALTMARTPAIKVLTSPSTKRRAQLHAGHDIIDPIHRGITGSSQIKTTYAELTDFFHLTSTEKVRTYGKVVGQAIVDRATLYNLADQSMDDSSPFIYAGVQWSVIECPFLSKSLALKRDSCFLEVLSMITLKDPSTGRERRGFVRAIHSVELQCCSSLRASHNIVRSGFVRSGHVFLETELSGLFDHYYAYVIANPGGTPHFVNQKVCERIVGQMLNIEHHFAQHRLPKLLYMAAQHPRVSYKSTDAVQYCDACDAKFHLLRPKRNCYLCRQVVCRHCIQTHTVPVGSEPKLKVSICTVCFCGNSGRRNLVLNALTMAASPAVKVVEHAATKRRAQLHYGTDIVDSSLYGLTGSSQIKATADELVDFFHLTTAKKVRTYGEVVGQIVLDRVTLYHLADRAIDASSQFLYAGVQWSAIGCPFISPSLTLKRDTCFLEVLHTIAVTDPVSGRLRRGLVRALHSVALDCCPSLRASHNIVRGALVRSGHVFLETDEAGLYDHYYTYVVADPGNVPKFLNLKIFQRIVGQMLNLEHHLALQRLPSMLLTGNPRPPFKSTHGITYCEACDTKFKLLRLTKSRCPMIPKASMSMCARTVSVATQPGVISCHPLSSNESRELINLADTVCADVVASALAIVKGRGDKAIRHPRTKRRAHLFHHPDGGVTGATQLVATLDEIRDFFHITTPKQLRTHSRVVCQTILDWVTLIPLECTTQGPFRFTCVQWAAMESPLPGVIVKRDACFLQSLRDIVHTDAAGVSRRGFVRTFYSIEVDCCPSMSATHNLTRAHLHSGHIFLETAEEHVFDYYMSFRSQARGNVPKMISTKVIEGIVAEMLNVEDHFCSNRLEARLAVQRRPSMPGPLGQLRQRVAYCNVCFKKFGLLASKLQCFICNQMSLPLPHDFFRCPPLSASERQAFVQQAHHLCFLTARNAVSMAAKGPPVKVLIHAQTQRPLQIYHGSDVLDSTLDGVTGVTQVKASFEEIADFYNLSSDEGVVTFGKVFAQTIVDRCSLYTLRRSTKRSLKHAGISWIAITAPYSSKAILKRRDSCVLEATREYEMQCPETKAVRRCWVRALHSLEMDCCPSLERTHNIIRGRLVRSGHVFMETEKPGILNYFLVYIGEAYGTMPRFVQQKCLERMLPPMLHLEPYLERQRLSFYFLHHPLHPIRKHPKAPECGACRTAFGFFHGPKTQCQVCEEAICKACHVPVAVEIRQSTVNVMVCRNCLGSMLPRTEFLRRHHAASSMATMSMFDVEASRIALDASLIAAAENVEIAFGLPFSTQAEQPYIVVMLQPLHRANLITKAHEVVQDVVKNAMTMASLPVSKVLRNDATRLVGHMHEGYDLKDPSLIGMTMVTPVRATFDQIADFYALTSPRKLRTYAGVVGQSVLDRVTLYNLLSSDSDLHRPLINASVIWSVMESPFLTKSLAMKRDCCYLECISENYLEDPQTGMLRRAWVRAVHSVDMPCCPPMQASHGFVRGHLVRSGQIFLETDTPGVLNFYWCCITEPNGRLPKMIHRKVLQRIVGQAVNLEQHFCMVRLTQYMATAPKTLPWKNVKKTLFCERCDDRFGPILATKTQCTKCGWVVCKRCCKPWTITVHGERVDVTICTHCFCGKELPSPSVALLEHGMAAKRRRTDAMACLDDTKSNPEEQSPWEYSWLGLSLPNGHGGLFPTSMATPGSAAVQRFLGKPITWVHGSPRSMYKDLVYMLLHLSWPRLWLFLTTLYFSVTVAFGGVFYFVCRDCDTIQEGLSMSYQAFSTIGFGIVYPMDRCGNYVILTEAFVSMMLLPAIGGLLYSKISIPKLRVAFSNVCVVHPHGSDGRPALVLRVANPSPSLRVDRDVLLDVSFQAEVHISTLLPGSMTPVLQRYPVTLKQSNFIFFRFVLDLVHVIDDASPLRCLLTDDPSTNFVLQVTMQAVDSNRHGSVLDQCSYSSHDVRVGYRFARMVHASGKELTLDFDQLHALEEAPFDLQPAAPAKLPNAYAVVEEASAVVPKNTPFGSQYLFYRIMNAHWLPIVGVNMSIFLTLSLFFGFLHWFDQGLFVLDGLTDHNSKYELCFYLSVHSISTIGYGTIGPSPNNIYHNAVIAAEAIFGLTFSAIFTGICWSKFAKPHAHIKFSKQILLTHMYGSRCLVFRALNVRNVGEVCQCRFKLGAFLTDSTNVRRMHDLRLVQPEWSSSNVPITLVHIIDESSPLAQVPDSDMRQLSLLALCSGFDTTFFETVYARRVYAAYEMERDRVFQDAVTIYPDRVVHEKFVEEAHEACENTVRNALAMAAMAPTRTLRHPRTKRFAQMHHGPDIIDASLQGTTAVARVEASLDELIAFFDLRSPKQLRTYGQVAATSVLDRATLHTLVDHGTRLDILYVGIHWVAVEMPLLFANRDGCYIEAIKEFTFEEPFTHERRRGLVRTLHSIEIAHCPSLEASHNLRRGQIVRSGNVFMETEVSDVWDYYLVYVTNPQGKVPSFLNTKINDRQAAHILNLEEHICLERWKTKIDAGTFVPKREPSVVAKNCRVCRRRFQPWKHYAHCECCGEPVCRRCSHEWDVHLPYKVFSLVLCAECFTSSPLPTRRSWALTKLLVGRGDDPTLSEPRTLSTHSSRSSRGSIDASRTRASAGSIVSYFPRQVPRGQARSAPSSVRSHGKTFFS